MASFIHNEPTSLAILQEANIPQTFLASVSKEIPTSPDVVMAIPGAFGAICLNSAGLMMFKESFDLKRLFDIFTSIPHVRAFQDNDGASNLGMTVDELVRHQPSLKPTVLTAVIAMLEQVFTMCRDITFADDLELSALHKERSKCVPAFGEVTEENAAKVPKKDGLVPPLIEAAAKVITPGCILKAPDDYNVVVRVITTFLFIVSSSARAISRTLLSLRTF